MLQYTHIFCIFVIGTLGLGQWSNLIGGTLCPIVSLPRIMILVSSLLVYYTKSVNEETDK